MRYVALMSALACVLGAMSMGAEVSMYMNLPSAVIVLAVGFGTLVFAHGGESVALLFRALFSDVAPEEAGPAAEIAQSASTSFLQSGALGFIIGVVAMLANLDDPRAIGPAVAVALLTLLYGVGFSVFFWKPAERRMRAQLLRTSAS